MNSSHVVAFGFSAEATPGPSAHSTTHEHHTCFGMNPKEECIPLLRSQTFGHFYFQVTGISKLDPNI